MKTTIKYCTILCLGFFAACSTEQPKDGPPAQDTNIIKPLSQYGNNASYSVNGRTYHVLKTAKGYDKKGIASWYGTKFQGKLTSDKEPYDMFGMTAASPELPLPTYVRVTNLQNNRQVVVKVNDRGPFDKDRIIDLSYAAAKQLGFAEKGTAFVEVTAIDPATFNPNSANAMLTTYNTNPIHLTQLYLQAGSFTKQQYANHLCAQIDSISKKPAFIIDGSHDNKSIYRVQIGPLASVSDHDNIQKLLAKHGIQSITVIK